MKRLLQLQSFFLATLLFSHSFTYAQNLTGIWRGNFFSENGQQYKFELQLEQKGNAVSGVSYSYLTTVFYGKATLTGNFSKTSQKALVEEIKTVEVRMEGGSTVCIMKCRFEYSKSGREEFLEGTYTSKYEKNGYGAKKGDDCGGGTVYLRRVTTSDFYIEPFLRNKIKPNNNTVQPPKIDSLKTTPPVVKKNPATKPKTTTGTTTKPKTTATTKPPVTKPNTTKTTVTNKPPVAKNTVISKSKIDSVTKIEKPDAKETQVKIAIPKPKILTTRTNELVKTLVLNDENVTVKIYDNGEIDDDTISVYLDNKLVLSKKRLTASALTVKLKLDENNSEHELVMVAENLGRIPPNTSLMIVECGDDRYDVRITSTHQKNAMVRFKYRKKENP
jgi:hypothetical protein